MHSVLYVTSSFYFTLSLLVTNSCHPLNVCVVYFGYKCFRISANKVFCNVILDIHGKIAKISVGSIHKATVKQCMALGAVCELENGVKAVATKDHTQGENT